MLAPLDWFGPMLFPYWSFWAVPWWAGAMTAAALWSTGRPLHKVVGIGIMSVPIWDTLWAIIESFGPLLAGGGVLRPISRYGLSGLYSYKFLADLGYLGMGFLLYASDGSWRTFWSNGPVELARKLRTAGLPMGRRSEGGSLLLGVLSFPLLLIVTIVVNLFLMGFQSLQQGDETSIWDNMTFYHALLISAAAAFGEELLYRGFAQTVLARRMPMLVAVLLQALFFAFAHSGYGTWIHVMLPFFFGLIAGIVAWRFGIWAAIALHFLVDVYAFGFDAADNQPWVGWVLSTLLIANAVAMLAAFVVWIVRRVQGGKVRPVAAS